MGRSKLTSSNRAGGEKSESKIVLRWYNFSQQSLPSLSDSGLVGVHPASISHQYFHDLPANNLFYCCSFPPFFQAIKQKQEEKEVMKLSRLIKQLGFLSNLYNNCWLRQRNRWWQSTLIMSPEYYVSRTLHNVYFVVCDDLPCLWIMADVCG